jgi:cell division protein FtsL
MSFLGVRKKAALKTKQKPMKINRALISLLAISVLILSYSTFSLRSKVKRMDRHVTNLEVAVTSAYQKTDYLQRQLDGLAVTVGDAESYPDTSKTKP